MAKLVFEKNPNLKEKEKEIADLKYELHLMNVVLEQKLKYAKTILKNDEWFDLMIEVKEILNPLDEAIRAYTNRDLNSNWEPGIELLSREKEIFEHKRVEKTSQRLSENPLTNDALAGCILSNIPIADHRLEAPDTGPLGHHNFDDA